MPRRPPKFCQGVAGVEAAQLRKEAKYTKLLEDISASNFWKPRLLTLEVGARGLVASRTFRAFVSLGFPGTEAKKLCKSLSEVAARCSYAIYLAHKHKTWIRSDLIDLRATQIDSEPSLTEIKPRKTQVADCAGETNVAALRRNDITVLYHFTDAANLDSIRKQGLLP